MLFEESHAPHHLRFRLLNHTHLCMHAHLHAPTHPRTHARCARCAYLHVGGLKEADQADEELRKKEEVDLLKMHRQMKLRKLQAEEFALAKQVETAERDRILADHAEHEVC